MYSASRTTNMTVTARSGTTLTANATIHTEAASWTILIADSGVQAEGIWFRVTGLHASGTASSMLIDIAYGDVTTGGNEVEVVTDHSVGNASTVTADATMGRWAFVPYRIPANKSISARVRGLISSDTCICAVMLNQDAVHIENAGTHVAYGVSTASSIGTSVPMGNGAFGAWTEIGTLSSDAKLFLPSFDFLGDTTNTVSEDCLLQLGYGATAPGAGGTAIEAYWTFYSTGSEATAGPFPADPVYTAVASGTKIWARLAGGHTENRGVAVYAWNGTVVTAGGAGGLLTHPGMSGGMRG